MVIAEAEWLSVLLRALTYAGTVLVAGSLLFRATFPCFSEHASAGRRQLLLGAAILIVCEPLRYLLFQLQISGGDLTLGLSPSMRWIGLETPLGQASVVRLCALAVILSVGLRWGATGLAAALVMVGSYLLEGHTLASDQRALLAPMLFAHLLAVHWWIGALPALFAATSAASGAKLVELVKQFGRYAVWMVAALFIAGGILLGVLTGWQIDLANTYQQAFMIKLGAVIMILSIAAINRRLLTPRLECDHVGARACLRISLVIETATAIIILLATALAVSFSPAPD